MDAAVSGEAAVRASQRSGALRSVASAADLAVAEQETASDRLRTESAGAGGARVAEQRIVAGRTFRLTDGVWTERRSGDEEHDTIAVALFSDAYFEVIRALPELRPVVMALSPVSSAGSRVRIVFGDEGERALSSRRLARLVAGCRSRNSRRGMAVDWKEVYRSTFPDLVRYLHRKVWDADRARDLAQEAFARSLEREPADPRSWVFTVAANLARDEARTEIRRRRHLTLINAERQAEEHPPDALRRLEREGRLVEAYGERDQESDEEVDDATCG